MGSKALVLSFLLLLVGAALCSNVPQQELTWRAALTQVAARSVEPNDNEGEGGSGSGGGNPTPSASPTPIPPKIFASSPYLPVPECANFAPSADEALPAETLVQLQWRAMCELTCISITLTRGTGEPSYDLSFVGLSIALIDRGGIFYVSDDAYQLFKVIGLSRLYKPATSLVKRFFSQTNPIWKVFSTEYETRSSGNCETYNRVEECTRGCVAQRESRGVDCEEACGAQCRVECPGSSVCPDRVNECYTSCVRTIGGPPLCRDGCRNEVCDDVSRRLAAIYPNMTNPGVAPSFRRNGVKLGTFYINPVRSPRLLFEGNITALLFRVEDADNPGIVSYHLPLTENAPIEELDLSAWVCKRVDVSFSVISFDLGLSEFSPATTVEVFPGVTQFPEQLTGFNLSSTPDINFFGAYILTITWTQPMNVNLADNYTITIRSASQLCRGLDYTYTVDVNVTESILRRAGVHQFYLNCLLTVTIQVNPLRPDGSRPNSNFHKITKPYPVPNIEDIICNTNWRIDDQTYDVNISWHMEALFISGIDYFVISADRYRDGEFFNPFPISTNVREDAKIGVTDYNLIFMDVGFDLRQGFEYRLIVEVFWKNPNIGLPAVNTFCFVSASPPNPSPVQDLQITSIAFHEKLLIKVDGLRLRRLVVSVNFNWTRPFVPFSSLTGYDVWIGPQELLADDTVTNPSNAQRIPLFVEMDTGRQRRQIFVSVNFNWTRPLVPFRSLTEYNVWLGPRELPADDTVTFLSNAPIMANVTDSFLMNSFTIALNAESYELFLQIQAFGDPLMSNWSAPAQRISLNFDTIRVPTCELSIQLGGNIRVSCSTVFPVLSVTCSYDGGSLVENCAVDFVIDISQFGQGSHELSITIADTESRSTIIDISFFVPPPLNVNCTDVRQTTMSVTVVCVANNLLANGQCTIDGGNSFACPLTPISIPYSTQAEGNHMLTFRIIDTYRQISEVITRNYIVPDLDIFFVEGTPIIEARSIYARFEANRDMSNMIITCQLIGSVEDRANTPKEDCISGVYNRTGLLDRTYILRLEAQLQGQRRAIRRRLPILPTSCSAYLINRGVSIDNGVTTIEFRGSGGATNFYCLLNEAMLSDPCTSPVSLSNLASGTHKFTIRPQGCAVRQVYAFTFTVP